MTTVTSGCFKWFLSSKQNTEAAFNDEQIQLDEFKRKKTTGDISSTVPATSQTRAQTSSSACVLIQKACIEWYETLLNTKVPTKHASPLCESLGRVRHDTNTSGFLQTSQTFSVTAKRDQDNP